MYYLVFLSVIVVAIASPTDIKNVNDVSLSKNLKTRNSLLENLVLDLLEDLRKTMVTGSNDIPILDPLEIQNLHLDEEILPIPGAQVILNDLNVTKLSTFVVDKLSVGTASIIPQRYRLEFDFHVPVLEVDSADYDLSVSVAGVHIFGKGDAKIKLIEPRVNGSLLLSPRFSIGSGLYLTIATSEVTFNLKAFESGINGLLNDDAMSTFINTFLSYFVPELVELYRVEITEALSAAVLDIGNNLLADFNLGSLLGI